MASSDGHSQIQEYVRKLRYLVYLPLKFSGMSRFDVKDSRIEKISYSSTFCTGIILAITNYCAFHILYRAGYKEQYLILPEMATVVLFDVFQTCVLLNIAIANKGDVAQYINTGIEIDTFLGVEETEFLREISARTYVFLVAIVGFFHAVTIVVSFFTYLLPDTTVYYSGAIYFTLLFFIYYDLAFFVTLYTFLTLRVRYLNISIMKIGEIDLEYLPPQFPFNTIYWRKELNELVEIHTRAEPRQIVQAFTILFDQLRCIEKCYRFTIFSTLSYLTIGTFLIVQNFVAHAKSPDMDVLRLITLTGWGLLSLSFQVAMAQQTDMLYGQIKQTNLICTCIQLKPTYPDEVYKLTRSIIRTLEVRDARVSIYGLFYYDSGIMLRIGASLFVYITMQLQVAFPKIDDMSNNVANCTNCVGSE